MQNVIDFWNSCHPCIIYLLKCTFQTEWFTHQMQKLNQAKMTLLDESKRSQYNEEMFEEGIRNPNAKPLLCDIW